MWSLPPGVHDLADEEHFTAEHALRYFLEGRGMTAVGVGVQPTVIGTFLPYTWRRLVAETKAVPAPQWIYEHDHIPLYHGNAGDQGVTVTRVPVGAPAAVSLMEFLIALGARRFLLLGAAGSLQEAAPIGSAVIPTETLREDGTSYHYQGPEVRPAPSADLVRQIDAACRRRGVEPLHGLHWSTDALFRELKKKVLHYRSIGVLSVDMEAAAMYAAGAFRGVDVALLLGISDELFRPWAPAFLHRTYRETLATCTDALIDVAAAIAPPS